MRVGRNKRCFWLRLLLSILCCACGQTPPEKDEPESSSSLPPAVANKEVINSGSQLQCTGGTLLTYGNFGQAFMLNYCTGCHSDQLTSDTERLGAPSNLNFNSLDGIVAARTKILLVAGGLKDEEEAALTEDEDEATGTTMPPGREVEAEERKLLREWLSCGAPGDS